MADIVYKFDQMRSAAAKVEDISQRYKAASDKFQSEFADATKDWERRCKCAQRAAQGKCRSDGKGRSADRRQYPV